MPYIWKEIRTAKGRGENKRHSMNPQTGKYIIMIGLGLVALGLVVYFFHDKLHWIGRLPGDIRIQNEHLRFYFPITTMLLLSLLVSLLLHLVRRFL